MGRGKGNIVTGRFRMVEPCSSFFDRNGTELLKVLGFLVSRDGS